MQPLPQTVVMIKTALECDSQIDPQHKRRIMAALKDDGSGKRKTITIKQAAVILDCHPLTVYRYSQQGHLRQIKLSPRHVRYDLEQVERLAAEGIQSEPTGAVA